MVESFRDRRVLVVGGAGFVGSNLCHELLTHGPAEVLVIDNLLSAERHNLPEADAVTFIEGSITDDKLLERIPDEIDYAFHLATYHGNQSSIHDPLADHEHNTFTSLKLFHRLQALPTLRKVVYASAGCTVAAKTSDAPNATAEDEVVSLYLDSPYQISKVIGELYGNYFFMHSGLPVVKARFQNVYGPREILGAGRWRGTPATIWRNVVPTFIYKALHGEALPIHGDGSATRDFIHVDDIVQGLLVCAARGEPGGVYNLASGIETSISDLARTINRLTDNQTDSQLDRAREWDRSHRRYGATEKSATQLGFRADIGLEDGIAGTVEWTRSNLDRIKHTMARHAAHLAS